MKKVFLAGIVVVVLIAAMGAAVTGKPPESKARDLFQPIDTEIRAYLAGNPSAQNLEGFTAHTMKKYNKKLTAIVDILQDITGCSVTPEAEDTLKQLIIREHIHRVTFENMPARENASVLEVEPVVVDSSSDGSQSSTTFYTPLAGVPYPIYYWKQVTVDITGGSGYDDAGKYYNVNGNNDLYKVKAEYTSTWVKYTLYFKDEDHPDPITDALYDVWRLLYYGRIEDIESFTVENNTINFNGIWDNDKTYAEPVGQHGNKTRSYGTTVYVSNVWNHAMDKYDNNPSMSKTTWYTGW